MPIKSGAPRRLVMLLLIAAAVIAIVGSAGSGGGGATARAAANVTITARDFFWSPDTVTIQVGDTVTWTNAQGFHNVLLGDSRLNQPGFPNDRRGTRRRSARSTSPAATRTSARSTPA